MDKGHSTSTCASCRGHQGGGRRHGSPHWVRLRAGGAGIHHGALGWAARDPVEVAAHVRVTTTRSGYQRAREGRG